MVTILNKSTHVFIKDENSFTAIDKKQVKGVHQIYTNRQLAASDADAIEKLFGAELEVARINMEKGFLFIQLKEGATFKSIENAIKTVLYD